MYSFETDYISPRPKLKFSLSPNIKDRMMLKVLYRPQDRTVVPRKAFLVSKGLCFYSSPKIQETFRSKTGPSFCQVNEDYMKQIGKDQIVGS